jgi:hypothetical protein
MSGTQQLQARSRTAGGWTLIILGTICAGMGTLFGGGIAASGEIDPFSLLFGGVGGLFALGGATAVGFGVRSLWLSRVLGRMSLDLPVEDPLALGGTKVVRFRRVGGAARAARAATVTAELTCFERVTYRQGTDTHTVAHELFRAPLAVFPEPVPGRVGGRVEILVPLTHPPSMALANNRIDWELTLRVRVAGLPDDSSTFVLPVAPVVAERALRGGGPE